MSVVIEATRVRKLMLLVFLAPYGPKATRNECSTREIFLSAALYNRGLHCGCRRHLDNCETRSGVQRVVFVQMDPLDKSHSAQRDCDFLGVRFHPQEVS